VIRIWHAQSGDPEPFIESNLKVYVQPGGCPIRFGEVSPGSDWLLFLVDHQIKVVQG